MYSSISSYRLSRSLHPLRTTLCANIKAHDSSGAQNPCTESTEIDQWNLTVNKTNILRCRSCSCIATRISIQAAPRKCGVLALSVIKQINLT